MHSKAFHALFKLIIDKCSLLKKVIFIFNFFINNKIIETEHKQGKFRRCFGRVYILKNGPL